MLIDLNMSLFDGKVASRYITLVWLLAIVPMVVSRYIHTNCYRPECEYVRTYQMRYFIRYDVMTKLRRAASPPEAVPRYLTSPSSSSCVALVGSNGNGCRPCVLGRSARVVPPNFLVLHTCSWLGSYRPVTGKRRQPWVWVSSAIVRCCCCCCCRHQWRW